MIELIHQRQPTNNSCVSTCLAMLAGLPAEVVIATHQDDYFLRLRSPLAIMEDMGMMAVPLSSLSNVSCHEGCVYLVTVQSLNCAQTSHQIILDCRHPDGYRIYDPQMGNDGCRFYVPHFQEDNCLEPLAVKFEGGWFADFRIFECPALGVIS